MGFGTYKILQAPETTGDREHGYKQSAFTSSVFNELASDSG